MLKLSLRWNILLGLLCLLIGFIIGNFSPPPIFSLPPIFSHLSIYIWIFNVLGAVFLFTASHQFSKKIKG